jgi:serine/threonine-protein kinase RsbW
MSDAVKIKLQIPSLSDYVGVVRLAVAGVASRMNFTHEEIEDIKIAVNEACTNVVQYAYPGSIGDIDIEFLNSNGMLKIIISDSGIGFNVDDKPTTQSEDPNKIGLGLGIVFMRSLMDDVDFVSTPGKGTVVTLSKKVVAEDS